MSIVCLTKDSSINSNLINLYNKDQVICFADSKEIQAAKMQNCTVLVVDLESSKIPARTKDAFPVVALSAMPIFHEALILLKRGVRGYGNRRMLPENLKQLIETVKTGQMWLPPELLVQFIANMNEGGAEDNNADLFKSLSKREKEVANYVAEGMTNQQMADTMFVSLRTVKAHLSSIYDKTGLKNRLELGLQLKNGKLS